VTLEDIIEEILQVGAVHVLVGRCK
jgi:hypothetical protein